ncbi:hypothetical protein [Facilibium subflavum]|uniref:hypothetical protein n=1 Tax=Facilibium subflavum TaxID=2219058 RepID=UPI0013C30025|nr:hypothetical protein [Facilibium subflavum]
MDPRQATMTKLEALINPKQRRRSFGTRITLPNHMDRLYAIVMNYLPTLSR